MRLATLHMQSSSSARLVNTWDLVQRLFTVASNLDPTNNYYALAAKFCKFGLTNASKKVSRKRANQEK